MIHNSNRCRTSQGGLKRHALRFILLKILVLAVLVLVTIPQAEAGSDTGDNEQSIQESQRQPPQILSNGIIQPIDPSLFQPLSPSQTSSSPSSQMSQQSDPPSVAQIPGGEAISLQYVQNFLSPDTIKQLIESCNARNGWTSSPQSVNGESIVKATRTSRSCPLIWPQLYLPYLTQPSMTERIAPLREEIELTWHLTQRIATFMGVKEEYVEPFQLVRYLPGEYYREHHDHGSYYGVETEQRPWTFLVFLSDIPTSSSSTGIDVNGDSGGYTKFRALGEEGTGGIAVVPRMGDGVMWRNVDDETGNILYDAVHEAVPPADNKNGVVKYAMNVWIAKDKIMENIDVSAYRTQ